MAIGLILAAAVITALALAPITDRFGGRARVPAVTGLVAFAMGAVLETVNRLITMGVTTWAAEQYPDESAVASWQAFDRLRLGTVFLLLGFLAVALFGYALVVAGEPEPRWVFVGVCVAGMLPELAGAAIPAYLRLATGALGIVAWRLPRQHARRRADDA